MGAGFHKDSKVVEKWGYGEVVAMVDSKSSLALRRRTKRVLDVVRSDLGAIDISEERLWGLKDTAASKKSGAKKENAKADEEEEKQDQYRVFLYLAGDKCVGLCLAERIRHAERVVDVKKAHPDGEDRPGPRSSCIRTETSLDAMLLGISRIWVSKSHRRKAIATTLLDCARSNFFYGIEVPKKMVAFSQPTESGGQLAEQWYGEKSGWHVYTEA